ncbi:MAG: Macrolide export ATP-binding/permease MacB [Clostridia bacterium]|jgi:putative ABC transport system permease protein|nr:Macrolide export ATP-binding/permease MacB [Clostridia bacterium]
MRKLFSNKLLLGALCIAIGMVPLLSLINTIESGKAAFAESFNKDGLRLIRVQLNEADATYQDLKKLEEEMPGIKAMIPIVKGAAQISSFKSQSSVAFKAVGSGYSEFAGLDILRGKFISKSHVDKKERVIVLDDLTADKLFGTTDILGRNVEISYNGAELEASVIGVCKRMDLSEGVQDKEQGIAYIPITTLDYNVDRYSVDEALFLVDIHIEEAKARVSHYLEAAGLAGAQEITYSNQFGIILSFFEENRQMILVAAALWFFIVLIALINILLVDVTQDKRYFGLLKFYGNTEKQIRRTIYAKALTMSLASSIFSIAISLITSLLINLYLNIPLYISVHTLTLGFLLPGVLSIMAAIYPAVKAAKTDMNKVIWQYE